MYLFIVHQVYERTATESSFHSEKDLKDSNNTLVQPTFPVIVKGVKVVLGHSAALLLKKNSSLHINENMVILADLLGPSSSLVILKAPCFYPPSSENLAT